MREIAQLDQSTWLRGKRCFTLQDDGVLHVSQVEAGRNQQFLVDVALLSVEPFHDKLRAINMIVGMVIFGLIALAFIMISIIDRVWMGWVMGGFFLFPFLLCMYSYLKQSYDVLVFQSPSTGGRIAFLNNLPSEVAFAAFIHRLRSEIKNQRDKLPALPRSLSQEIEALVKLHESGAINEAEFTAAKQNLINSPKSQGLLGFGSR